VVKLSHDAIIERLESFGLVHRSVQCSTEGEYLPADVDWNNKDVVHRNFVHSRIADVPTVVEKDLQAAVSFQTVLGTPFPMVLVHYDTGPNEQAHIVTALAWTMVTHHRFIPLSETRTRAVTTYTVASSRFAMLLWPAIRKLLQVNHRTLMSEDTPLRERRGRLRSWGYHYRGDGAPVDMRTTVSVVANNLVFPDPPAEPPTFDPVALSRLGQGSRVLVGRSDHLGLKLRRQGTRVEAYARLCPHEGAELDDVEVQDGCQTCPWHGRELPPEAVLDLTQDAPSAETTYHCLAVVDDEVRVTVKPAG
jgi:nitrite reductase/ring-hydroxylating ferredoxin subunit